jgi:hypothetical protein
MELLRIGLVLPKEPEPLKIHSIVWVSTRIPVQERTGKWSKRREAEESDDYAADCPGHGEPGLWVQKQDEPRDQEPPN